MTGHFKGQSLAVPMEPMLTKTSKEKLAWYLGVPASQILAKSPSAD